MHTWGTALIRKHNICDNSVLKVFNHNELVFCFKASEPNLYCKCISNSVNRNNLCGEVFEMFDLTTKSNVLPSRRSSMKYTLT